MAILLLFSLSTTSAYINYQPDYLDWDVRASFFSTANGFCLLGFPLKNRADVYRSSSNFSPDAWCANESLCTSSNFPSKEALYIVTLWYFHFDISLFASFGLRATHTALSDSVNLSFRGYTKGPGSSSYTSYSGLLVLYVLVAANSLYDVLIQWKARQNP